jgi:hypothetical protein
VFVFLKKSGLFGAVLFAVISMISVVSVFSSAAFAEECPVRGRPDALALGNDIAYGEPVTAIYSSLIQGQSAQPVAPVEMAYALYLVADRLGDPRAKDRQTWLSHYLAPSVRQRINTNIYQEHSIGFLHECFSISMTGGESA